MTYRLVGLMSVVLLLCMAIFAFATERYQDQLMSEVASTVSQVGRAAFGSIDSGHGIRVETITCEDADGDGKADRPVVRQFVRRSIESGSAVAEADREEAADRGDEQGHEIESGRFVVVTQWTGTVEPVEETERDAGGEPAGGNGGSGTSRRHARMVWVDAIHAEREPGKGFVLKIPTLPEDVADPGSGGPATIDIDVTARTVRETAEDARTAGVLQLPIAVGEYEDLFERFRHRSILLFLGVFAVGLALSTGLASRFTRPVRRLDGALRRLSDGDLSVEVPVRGRDEIARLGRAFNDVTRRLRAGRERERALTRRDKLSALGRLAAGVAHDVRNPLHSIGLTLQHLRETCRPSEPDRAGEFDRSLEVIRANIGRLDRLVQNFLAFAREGRRERSELDLSALVEEAAALVRKEAEWRGIEVRIDREGDVPGVRGDAESIRSALLNLVLNAFEAMPGGGRLTLGVAAREGAVELEVTDTGEGIPEEDHDRVFDFAWSTREDGHGLGLALVHQCVVEEHGGRVRLDSRPGEGTTMRLSFPVGSGNGGAKDRA